MRDKVIFGCLFALGAGILAANWLDISGMVNAQSDALILINSAM